MKAFSFSRLKSYADCPQRFRFKYLDRLLEPTSAAASRGVLFHSFAELYARHCHDDGDKARDYEYGRQLASSYPEDVRELAERYLEQVEFNWALIVSKGDSIERHFEVELPDDYGQLRGRVDLVQWNKGDAELWVTDLKSGFGGVKPEFMPPQLECYGWAMLQEFGAAKRVSCWYHYAGNGVRHDWSTWADELKPRYALSVIDRIRADEKFEATPGKACEWCGYTDRCPLVTADAIVNPTGQGTAELAYNQLLATKARAAKITDGLKAFTKDREALVVEERKVAGYGLPADHDAYEVLEGTSPEEVIAALREATEADASLWTLISPSKLGKLKEMEPETFFQALRFTGYSDVDLIKLFDPKKLGEKLAGAGDAGFGDEPGAERLRGLVREKPAGNRFSVKTCERRLTMKSLTVATVVTLALLAGMAYAEDEKQKTETTYKVGLDAESIGEVAKVLEQYVDGPLAIYYEGAVKVRFWQPLLIAASLPFGLVIIWFGIRRGAAYHWDSLDDAGHVFLIIIGGMASVACIIGLMVTGPQLIAPEYYAIRDIISTLR